jgi:mono/diheme cytochrome c family protein
MSKSLWTIVLAVVVFGLSVAGAVAVRRAWQPWPKSSLGGAVPSDGRGRLLFAAHCATCHGPEGHGDGPAVAGLAKPPADFAAGWKLAADAESMRRVIVRGIPGTAMPAAPTMTAADLDALVAYVRSLESDGGNPFASQLRAAGFAPVPRRSAPELDLADLKNGRPIRLADFSGKLLLVSFWTTDCAPCLAELPHLEKLANRFPERLAIVAACVSEEPDDAVAKAARGIDQIVAVDRKGLTRLRYDVQAMPTNVLIDGKGRILGRLVGPVDASRPEIVRLIEACIANADRP